MATSEEINNQALKASGPAELNPQEITTKEIKELGIPISSSIERVPEPVKCEYCGKTLYHEAVCAFGTIVCIRSIPQRCTCEKAVKHWEEYDKAEAERKEQERQKEEFERYLKRCHSAGIDKRHMNCSLQNYRVDRKNNKAQARAFDMVKDYIRHFDEYAKNGRSLYIEGTYGTGKTHLACAIAKELIKQEKRVICKTPTELLQSIRNAYDNNPCLTEQQIVDRFKKVDLLIVDDFGKQKPTEWGMATMYDILNYRYGEMLPTIITTNFNEDSLIQALSGNGVDRSKIESIISRFHQSADVITMAWSDYRGEQNG